MKPEQAKSLGAIFKIIRLWQRVIVDIELVVSVRDPVSRRRLIAHAPLPDPLASCNVTRAQLS